MNTAQTVPAAIRLTAIQHNIVATLSDGTARDREQLRAAVGTVIQYPHHLKPLREIGLIVTPPIVGVYCWYITPRGQSYLAAWRERRRHGIAAVDA